MASEAKHGAGVVDGFGGIFNFEDVAVGGEGGGGEVVAWDRGCYCYL